MKLVPALLLVSIAERDIIVNIKAVGSYLATHDEVIAAVQKVSASSIVDDNIREDVILEKRRKNIVVH